MDSEHWKDMGVEFTGDIVPPVSAASAPPQGPEPPPPPPPPPGHSGKDPEDGG